MANYYYWQNNGPVGGTVCPTGNPWPQPVNADVQLKVFNSGNKKDFKAYTLRGVNCDGSLHKLKEIIYNQCGPEVVPPTEKMEVGYFCQSKKMWINNRLDLQDALTLISRGDRITLWCVGVTESSRKRGGSSSDEEQEPESKKSKKLSKAEELKSLTEDYLRQLKEKHVGKFTHFQLKVWAEMLAVGTHDTLDEPPAASMFRSGSKPRTSRSDNDSVISGMMSMVNTLCESVVTNQNTEKKTLLSPVKKAELRTTYMRQLAELKKLTEADILTKEEYEEQRSNLVENMRHLSA